VNKKNEKDISQSSLRNAVKSQARKGIHRIWDAIRNNETLIEATRALERELIAFSRKEEHVHRE
jgi:hypothetical protein